MGKYDFPESVTIGEKYTDLLSTIITPEDANEYFEACVQHTMRWGSTREEAEEIERQNIGYVAGYFNLEENKRIQNLFRVVHPILGSAEQMQNMSASEIFNKGRELGSKK